MWSGRDTTPQAVEAALRSMLAERFRERHCSVPARYLNVITMARAGREQAVLSRLNGPGRHSVSRTIVLATSPHRSTIDALAEISCDVHPGPGEFGFLRETVILTIGERHLHDIETLVDPLLVHDLPTVLWASADGQDAVAGLLPVADVVLLDSMDQPDACEALRFAREIHTKIGAVDLAWVRVSPWRKRAAAAFDPPPLRAELRAIDAVRVVHHPASAASALLLVGWLASRLGWSPRPLQADAAGLSALVGAQDRAVRIELSNDPRRPVSELLLTVETSSGRSLSFAQGIGGLHVCARSDDRHEQCWTALGAWPDEEEVIERGIRETLVADRMYGESLAAANVLIGD
jgi:glucose-6-phosphate dehydrogenase assembly protein OpcA